MGIEKGETGRTAETLQQKYGVPKITPKLVKIRNAYTWNNHGGQPIPYNKNGVTNYNGKNINVNSGNQQQHDNLKITQKHIYQSTTKCRQRVQILQGNIS